LSEWDPASSEEASGSQPLGAGEAYAADVKDELRSLEEQLGRIPEVSAVRVVADAVGRPVEIHVLATLGRHPKQLVRDVQSVALASLGVKIDRRIVSVVQLGNGQPGRPGEVRAGRPLLAGISAEVTGIRSVIRVTLTRDDEEAVGTAVGSVAASAQHRLVASATLDALRQLVPGAEAADIDHAEVVRAGRHDVAVVTVTFFASGHERVLSGSALVVDHRDREGMARAVLAATNRKFAVVD